MPLIAIDDAHDQPIAVEVSEAVAALLEAPEPPLREITFTDCRSQFNYLSIELREYYAGRRPRADVSPWEGPRFVFPLLLGSGRVWHGEPVRGGKCRICHGMRLPRIAACLGCDRTGRDAEIPTPPREEVRQCRRAERERVGQQRRRRRRRALLKGGVG